MTTQDFIMTLFCHVDQQMLDMPKHPEAKLYPSEVVTLALLFAIKGGGMRAFYRWLIRDYYELFPQVPERTRLARLFKPTPPGRPPFWRPPPCWASLTAMASSCSTPCGKAGAPPRWARRARVIIGGSWEANSALP